jgi:hypothetical protein
MGWCGLDSSGLGYEPVEGSYEQSNEPSGSIKFWGNSRVPGSFSRRAHLHGVRINFRMHPVSVIKTEVK